MKYIKVLLMTIVSLSLVLNFVLLNKMGDLEDRISYLQTDNQQIRSIVNSIPSQVNHSLDEIKQMESWITPIRIDLDKSDSVKTNLKASWQIKDYDQGSVVLFHYREGEEEFKEIEAIDKGEGYFEADLSFDLDLEPQWIVNVQDRERPASVIPEKVKEDIDRTIEYYVSVKNKDKIKSSEISYYNLNVLANSLYGVIFVNVYANSQNGYDIHLNFEEIKHIQKVDNVNLKAYNNDKLVSTSTLQIKEDNDINQSYYIGYQNNEVEFNRLVIEVTYPNKKVFRKEIYTK